MGGDAVERRRKGQSLLLRGDTRLLAAGRANRDSGGCRQPADTDGLAEVKLLHTSDQPCVGHGDEMSACKQPTTRTIEHASWALPGLSWPVARNPGEQAGAAAGA